MNQWGAVAHTIGFKRNIVSERGETRVAGQTPSGASRFCIHVLKGSQQFKTCLEEGNRMVVDLEII